MARAQSHGTGAQEHAISRLLLAPPGPCYSNNGRAEARLLVSNPAETTQTYHVEFALQWPDERVALSSQTLAVAAGNHGLARHWFVTGPRTGRAELQAAVLRDGQFVSSTTWPLEILASPRATVPWAQAAWIDCGMAIADINNIAREQDLRAHLDALKEIGIHTIIVTYVEYVCGGMGAFYPSALPEMQEHKVPWDVVGTLMNQAERNGQKVILGLGRGTDPLLTWGGTKDPKRLDKELKLSTAVAHELWKLYGRSPALYGWYLSHEANDLEGAGAYYNAISATLHSFAPEKIVMISPSGTPLVTPAIIGSTLYDALVYQDAVGAGYVPYVYTYKPERRLPMLPDMWASYRIAHYGTHKHFWANIECWEMAGPDYTNSYAAPWSRFKQQLAIAAEYVEFITTYQTWGMMEASDTEFKVGGTKATDLYRNYAAYYRQIRAATQPQTIR